MNYLLPGILLIAIAWGSPTRIPALHRHAERDPSSASTPCRSPGRVCGGRTCYTSLTANAITLAIIFGVGFVMGFRTGASFWAWLAVIGILMLFTLALTWLAIIAGLNAKTVDGASAFSYR
ncbi:hypothetical protein ACU8V6_00175 [Vibrio alginolyticus]